MSKPLALLSLVLAPLLGFATTPETTFNLHMTEAPLALLAVGVFALAYLLVMGEEIIDMKKSKPVVLASGIIWLIIGILAHRSGLSQEAQMAARANLLEYAELLLILLVAMTYVLAMQERNIFEVLRARLVEARFSYTTLFWMTGFLAFFISPIADNLTTALVMCAVVMAVGADKPSFVSLCCINIVVAANAGGAFSPFGDITTLMVWQAGKVPFEGFFHIFLPSLINFLIPAFFMMWAIPSGKPRAINERVMVKPGGMMVVVLFLLTIATSVSLHNYYHLPPVLGMMTGLGYLKIFGYILKIRERATYRNRISHTTADNDVLGDMVTFNVFRKMQRLEWDTLMFFYGVMMCVGGLATLGYLGLMSEWLYGTNWLNLSPAYMHAPANVMIGLISAIIDNIPVMFGVLTMDPHMSQGQWLLATLTAGVGGSLLSIGSAAGVGLMGQAEGRYTFSSHLKWSWAILLGYFGSIAFHLWWNHALF